MKIEILLLFLLPRNASRAFFFSAPFLVKSVSTMNNLLEKAKSMGKVVADSGAKTMLKVSDISLLVDGLEFCSTNEL